MNKKIHSPNSAFKVMISGVTPHIVHAKDKKEASKIVEARFGDILKDRVVKIIPWKKEGMTVADLQAMLSKLPKSAKLYFAKSGNLFNARGVYLDNVEAIYTPADKKRVTNKAVILEHNVI